MATYRPIKTAFWDDDYIYELEPEEKLLFIFLITNTRVNLCGIYRVSLPYIYRMTGLSKDRIQKMLLKFEKDEKMKIVDKEWISIKNFVKHHTASPKITEGIKRELSEIPQEVKDSVYPIHRVGINLTKLNLTKLNTSRGENKFSTNKKTSSVRCPTCQALLPLHAAWHKELIDKEKSIK